MNDDRSQSLSREVPDISTALRDGVTKHSANPPSQIKPVLPLVMDKSVHCHVYINEMKDGLDEAHDQIEQSIEDSFKKHRLLNVTPKLAIHAALSNDKQLALVYLEEALLLGKETTRGQDSFRVGLMLVQGGKLNVGCGYRVKGMKQQKQGIEMLTRLYGENSEIVQKAKGDLIKLQEQYTGLSKHC